MTSDVNESDMHYGFCVLAEDMDKVNFKNLSNHGVTDLFLDYRCLNTHDKAQVETWIQDAKKEGISVHILAQIFNDDEKWYNPTNQSFADAKIKELKEYAGLKDLAGIHMNYVRYDGASAAENDNCTQAVSDFVVNATGELRKDNPNLILSSDVMPEYDQLKKKYCTDYSVISKHFDFVIPLTYFGNNNENDTFIQDSINSLRNHSQGAKIWANVQTFNNSTQTPIPLSEMNLKIQNISKANPDGIFFFRYGLSEDIDFNNLHVK
ncbi:hypothetical protein [Methanobrevibacter millerae]|uniref:Uncharacterized protein n=1 Tax=Methanobrevibacter millerae TaxID=230361 RepID=A0A1G5VPU9_9EURY|nr:hypothetical protein [Methanobrevibacter millerae]SDA47879.1 hypothetical protein SAMN02910315_00769 [Methanobrevibacter millerae]